MKTFVIQEKFVGYKPKKKQSHSIIVDITEIVMLIGMICSTTLNLVI